MDIGLLLHTRQIIRQEDAAKSFEQLWSDAAQAEELGFDHIWLGDSVTVLDKARGDCLTTMAALAARTNKIRIGAVPMLPALRNPVLLAHALATLDVISKGTDCSRRQRWTVKRLHPTPVRRRAAFRPRRKPDVWASPSRSCAGYGARDRLTMMAVTTN